MGLINDKLTQGYIWALSRLNSLLHDDNGDTNFISIAIVTAIVVVLAGIFLALGRECLNAVNDKVMDFING